MVGKVKWFKPDKGYGFIISDSYPNTDIFAHYTSIVGDGYKTLVENQIVQFEVVETNKGLMAKNIYVEQLDERK